MRPLLPLVCSLMILPAICTGAMAAPPAKKTVKKFPLPLPNFVIPENIKETILYLYKSAPSIVEFRERYTLVYEDNLDLATFLLREMNGRLDAMQPWGALYNARLAQGLELSTWSESLTQPNQ